MSFKDDFPALIIKNQLHSIGIIIPIEWEYTQIGVPNKIQNQQGTLKSICFNRSELN